MTFVVHQHRYRQMTDEELIAHSKDQQSICTQNSLISAFFNHTQVTILN